MNTCPECGHKLVVRQNRKSKSYFMGCSQYPICHYARRVSVEELEAFGLLQPFEEPSWYERYGDEGSED